MPPPGCVPRVQEKILDSNLGMANNFAMGPPGGHHVKTGDTVVRLPGLAMGGSGTLCHPRGASPGLGKKILYTKVGTAYNFAMGSPGGHHVKT